MMYVSQKSETEQWGMSSTTTAFIFGLVFLEPYRIFGPFHLETGGLFYSKDFWFCL